MILKAGVSGFFFAMIKDLIHAPRQNEEFLQ